MGTSPWQSAPHVCGCGGIGTRVDGVEIRSTAKHHKEGYGPRNPAPFNKNPPNRSQREKITTSLSLLSFTPLPTSPLLISVAWTHTHIHTHRCTLFMFNVLLNEKPTLKSSPRWIKWRNDVRMYYVKCVSIKEKYLFSQLENYSGKKTESQDLRQKGAVNS